MRTPAAQQAERKENRKRPNTRADAILLPTRIDTPYRQLDRHREREREKNTSCRSLMNTPRRLIYGPRPDTNTARVQRGKKKERNHPPTLSSRKNFVFTDTLGSLPASARASREAPAAGLVAQRRRKLFGLSSFFRFGEVFPVHQMLLFARV